MVPLPNSDSCSIYIFHFIIATVGTTAGGESDFGSVEGMMPEEVEAAFQVRL